MPVTENQKFTYREIPRNSIREAPYNPNEMADVAFQALKENIRASGLVDTLIWNEKTGNLVGGHHRLRAVDSLEYPNKNYKIGVAAVHLSEKREKEMNIFLNNAQAQGRFDKALFFKLLDEEPLMSLDAIGFNLSSLEMEFGDLPPIPQLADLPDFTSKVKPAVPPRPPLGFALAIPIN